ncbi:androgen-induced gene 1 protein isoform X6 [Mustela putorius furo]|uniref:Androgen-induced gene 1 protein isoform X6 n=1 Tax=Mustela putorius furo TaxID=9669 RepID=A0A8U0RDP8_MUSPF|nr:androgen-induced gene 1 protein isoform X6 [Mustela putorius furo]
MALVPCQVLRVAILLSYCSILCNYKAIEMPSHQTYGGSWKFLTFIDLFVVAVFWIIYAYDREMIYPKLLDNFIPGWLNHGMHTTVLPFILIEMRTSHHAYPSRSSGLAAICTFSVGYILWDKEYQRRTRFKGEEHDFGCTYMDFEVCLRCIEHCFINFSETKERSGLRHRFVKFPCIGFRHEAVNINELIIRECTI